MTDFLLVYLNTFRTHSLIPVGNKQHVFLFKTIYTQSHADCFEIQRENTCIDIYFMKKGNENKIRYAYTVLIICNHILPPEYQKWNKEVCSA